MNSILLSIFDNKTKNLYILDKSNNSKIEVSVVKCTAKEIPSKKNGWLFNWRSAYNNQFSEVFLLKTVDSNLLQGAIELIEYEGMLVMNIIEVSPKSRGTEMKKYDRIAGILIAFGCEMSFMLETNYKGHLIFDSKTDLISHYQLKYGAVVIRNQKMVIEPIQGQDLISKYLKDKI